MPGDSRSLLRARHPECFCATQARPSRGDPDALRALPAVSKPQFPALLPNAAELQRAATAWSQQDIELARARCAVLLKNLPVVTMPVDPIREGSECGAAAPVRLISIGRSPQVALSPPPDCHVRHGRGASSMDGARRAAAGKEASRRPGDSHRDHELLLLPQRLRPRRQPPERARQGQCARRRLVRHRARPERHGGRELGTDGAADRGPSRRRPRPAGQA